MTKRQQNAIDKRINAAFSAAVEGRVVAIDILDLSKITRAGREAIANGATEEQLVEAVAAVVAEVGKPA